MENVTNQTGEINALLMGSIAPVSLCNTMISSSYGLSLLYLQAAQHHQNSGQIQMSNTSKCIIDILNQGKYEHLTEKIINALT